MSHSSPQTFLRKLGFMKDRVLRDFTESAKLETAIKVKLKDLGYAL